MITPSQKLQKKLHSFQQKYSDKENVSPNRIEKQQKMKSVQQTRTSNLFLKGIDNFSYKKEETEVNEVDYKEKNVADHFNNYWQFRTEKLNHQISDIGVYSGMNFMKQGKTLLHDSTVKPIFQNLTIYINGRFEVDSSLQHEYIHYPADMYTHFHISHIVGLHGGKVLPYLAKKQITHVICNHFSASKQVKVNESLSKTKANEAKVFYVRADWIFSCIKEGKVVAEDKYLVDTTSNYFSIDSFFKNVE